MSNPKVALYLRLSKEDEDKKNESESITNQRNFLIEYITQRGWVTNQIYTDDGYSGTSFDRPGFNHMISDIEEGKIDIVITKDLSRLGRDYIQTGYYLEKYFPEKGIRYIAVNDGIDTFLDESQSNDMSPFKSVINDMYAKDISKKVRTALNIKKKNGKFIGSFAPFGYKKDPKDKGHLVVDDDTAKFVRDIYRLFLNGNNITTIAKILTENKVPTPSQVRGRLYKQYSKQSVWNDVIIKRILTNETYIGNLTQNKSRKINYKVNKKVNLKMEDWIIVENTHEPIISRDDFERVKAMFSKKKYCRRNINKEHLLSGIIFCSDCNGPMTFIKESPTRTYLVCSTWRKSGKVKLCTSHCIRSELVERAVIESLSNLVKGTNLENKLDNLLEGREFFPKQKDRINELTTSIQFCKQARKSLFIDKMQGIITDEDYRDMIDSFYEEEINKQNEIKDIQRYISNHNNTDRLKERITNLVSFMEIDRKVLLLLVEKIIIYTDKKIDLILSFKNPNLLSNDSEGLPD